MADMPPPGPERDAAIAAVLGRRALPECYCEQNPTTICTFFRGREHDVQCQIVDGPFGAKFGCLHHIVCHKRNPEWSTDDHAALDLLEEMKRRGWRVEIDGEERWGVALIPKKRGKGHAWEWVLGNEASKDFADAVSAAVLRAVRAEREVKGGAG